MPGRCNKAHLGWCYDLRVGGSGENWRTLETPHQKRDAKVSGKTMYKSCGQPFCIPKPRRNKFLDWIQRITSGPIQVLSLFLSRPSFLQASAKHWTTIFACQRRARLNGCGARRNWVRKKRVRRLNRDRTNIEDSFATMSGEDWGWRQKLRQYNIIVEMRTSQKERPAQTNCVENKGLSDRG